ncbi:Retroelement pol polyprotein-like [Rhynchospora pubera]|uniref:Retroelement pol polyprotein-like n=1 Tax=Rhynchospora pubera TaxID=906938 RepID=A0AAV8C2T5_9POAL|nr:Retroelement pol polyprotein-like [Rhynchospora pubera]
MLVSWLFNSIDSSLQPSVAYFETAKELWDDLKERFSVGNAPRIYQLKSDIAGAKQQGQSVVTYYTRLKSMWDELGSYLRIPACTCGGCVCNLTVDFLRDKEEEKIHQFLMGLDDVYDTIRTTILSMDPLPSLNKVYSTVIQEERHKSVVRGREEHSEAVGFAVHVRKGEKPTCTHCGKVGHEISQCFEIVGYPEGWGRGRRGGRGGRGTGGGRGRGRAQANAMQGDNSAAHDVSGPGTQPKITGLSDEQVQQIRAILGSSNVTFQSDSSDKLQGLHFEDADWCGQHNIHHGGEDQCITKVRELRQLVQQLHERVAQLEANRSQDRRMRHGLSRTTTCENRDRRPRHGSSTSSNCENRDRRLRHGSSTSNTRVNRDRRPRHDSSSYIDFFSHHRQQFISSDNVSLPPHLQQRNNHFVHVRDSGRKYDTLNRISADPDDNGKDEESNPFHDSKPTLMSCVEAARHRLYTQKSTCFQWVIAKSIQLRNDNIFQISEKVVHESIPFDSPPIFDKYPDDEDDVFIVMDETETKVNLFDSPIFIDEEVVDDLSVPSTSPTGFAKSSNLESNSLSYVRDYLFVDCTTRFWFLMCYGLSSSSYSSSSDVSLCLLVSLSLPIRTASYPFGKKGWRALDLETNNFVISRDIVFVENEFPFVKTYEDNGKSGCDLDKRSFGDVLNVHESDLTVQNDAIGDEGSELQARGSDQSGHKCQNSDTSVDCAPEMNPQETEPNDSYVTDATTMTQEVTRDLMPRTRQPPAKLRDYICYTAQVDHSHAHPTSTGSSGTPYSISHYVNCNNFSMAHRVFLNAVTKEKEPEYFGEAMKNKNWQEAMKAEIKALEANGTWTVEELPQGKTPIGCKWVYRIKYHSDGTIERYKARLVALGNRQVEGIDYTETFSPVAKMGTIRTVLAVAIAKGWELHQMDVHNAFLHGELHEEVYMRLPPGFTSSLSGKVCQLKKSLYGLRQAPRMWFSKLTTALQKYGFTQSRADYSLFVCAKGTTFLTVLVYVDDLIVAGNDCEAIKKFKQYLSGTFHMKDLGLLKYFLGIEMARGSTGLFLSQRKYTLDILAECGLLGAKPAQTPIEQNHNLSKATGVVMLDPEKYRRLIGRLIYLTFTRPELCYAVHVLAQFMQAPLQTHYDAALRVVRYLKGHPGQGILLRTDSDLKLYGYCDSDWASCPITRRSLTGYFVKLGNSPISWRTKKQPTVSRSSAEAEYRSMATLTCELTWLKSVLSFLGVSQVQPTQLFCDSQAALHIAANPVFHERTKHIEVDCHFVRDQIRDGRISTAHVSSSEQLADLFTKALGKKQFDYLTSKLGICDLHAPT